MPTVPRVPRCLGASGLRDWCLDLSCRFCDLRLGENTQKLRLACHGPRSFGLFRRIQGRRRSGSSLAPRRCMGWHRFEEIGAWQRADELSKMVSAICRRASFNRDERLRGQLLDAGRSGPRNIAEGFARWKHGDFARFVRIAKGVGSRVAESLQRGVQDAGTSPRLNRSARTRCAKGTESRQRA